MEVPKDTLTKKFNCDYKNLHIVTDFTNLNSDDEQVLLDDATMTTHEHYCIDVVKHKKALITIGLVCDPCTTEKPCVSVCREYVESLEEETRDTNFTRVITYISCLDTLTLSSEFFMVKVHDILVGYKDYCLISENTLNVCKDTIIKIIIYVI